MQVAEDLMHKTQSITGAQKQIENEIQQLLE